MTDQKMLGMDDLYQKTSSGGLAPGEVILDVRTPEEFAEGHVEGAINIPHEEVLLHGDELKKYKTIYIHCKMGGRARFAFDALKSIGLQQVVCIGQNGMKHWAEKGYPVKKP